MFSTYLPKEFWNFISARLFFVLALRMITTVVIYQVFKLSNTYMVGIAGLTEFLPAIVTAIYAGQFIDTHDKKNTLQVSYILYFLCALVLGFISNSSFSFSAHQKIYVILFVVFCTGIIRSFAAPATNSMIAAIVPRVNLQKAISLNSSTYLIASIVGHATGGLLIGLAGIASSYFVSASLIIIASFFAYKLSPKPPILAALAEPKIQAIKKGFSFVWQNKIMLGVISLDLFAVLFGGAVAFIPEVAETILHTSPIGYGFLNAAMDIGALISVAILFLFPMKQKQGIKMMFAVAGFGLCIILFGISKIYWLSFLALASAGICDGISVVVRGTIAQLFTPDELRGRVSSINMIFINSSNELGQFESGFTSKIFGTLPAIIIGGAMSIVVVIATWIKFPNLRKIKY